MTRWCALILPLDELVRRYLQGRGDEAGRMAGVWVDDALIQDLPAAAVVAELGLDFVTAGGARPFAAPGILGLLRFPLTEALAGASALDVCAAFGGELPTPSPDALWRGNGFAPGARLVPEYRLDRSAVPEGAELHRWDSAGRVLLGRWLRGHWV